MFRTHHVVAAIAVITTGPAFAGVTTDPYLFADSIPAPTGTLEWDTFAGGFTTAHTPDVAEVNGSGTIDASGVTGEPFGFPVASNTGTGNLYSGTYTGTYAIDLTDLVATEAHTTLVLQIAHTVGVADYSTPLLDGDAPDEFLNRGSTTVTHGELPITTEEAANPTQYLWAQWQLDPGQTAATISFDTDQHTSLAAVRIDYLNSASAFDATAPGLVPEPGSLALLGLGGLALMVRRKR